MSYQPPTVSVIIPCYRGERFVAEAIHSVLAQKGAVVEVIVVDDGSPDRSGEIVVAMGDPRIHLLRHEKNRGIAAARNTGLAAAHGEYVAFLDQDDLWLPGFVESTLRVLRASAAQSTVLAFCDAWVRDRSGGQHRLQARVPRGVDNLATEALLAAMLREKFVVLGAALIRRNGFDDTGGFDESIGGGSDDFDMLVRLAERGGFARVSQPLLVRRLHAENYTNAELMIDESLAVIDRVKSRHPALARDARIGRGRKLYRRASDALAAGRSASARSDYRRALREWPWQPRAWVGLAIASSGGLGAALLEPWRRSRGS